MSRGEWGRGKTFEGGLNQGKNGYALGGGRKEKR